MKGSVFMHTISGLLALAAATLLLASVAFAQEPSATPPSGNTAPPINTSSTAQTKTGAVVISSGASLGSLIVNGGSVFNDDVVVQKSGGELRLWADANAGAISNASGFSSEAIYLQDAGNLMRFYVAGSERIRINGSGNVGIGTSAPAQRLHVGGSGETLVRVHSSDNTGNSGIQFTGAGDRGSVYGTAGYDIVIEPNAQYADANVVINTKNGTTANAAESGLVVGASTKTTGLRVDVEGKIGATEYCDNLGGNCITAANIGGLWDEGATAGEIYYDGGNVGIGTDNPSQLLDVVTQNSHLRIQDVSASLSQLRLGSDNSHRFDLNVNGNIYQDRAPGWVDAFIVQRGGATVWKLDANGNNFNVRGTGTNRPFTVNSAAPTGSLVVDASGNVTSSGIGRFDGGVQVDGRTMISADGYTHNIQSTTESRYGYLDLRDDSGSRGAYFGYGNGASRVDLALDDATNLYVSGGSMSIGTTYTDGYLNVRGSATGSGEGRFLIGTGANNSGYSVQLGANDDGVNFTAQSASRGFNFNNNNGNLLTVQADGDVGINIPSPSAKLHLGQSADYVGMRISGYDDESSDYIDMHVGGVIGRIATTKTNLWFQVDGVYAAQITPTEFRVNKDLILSGAVTVNDDDYLRLGSNWDYKLHYNDSTKDLVLSDSNDGNEFLNILDQGTAADFNFNEGQVFVRNDGDVGVGDTTPDGALKLDVEGQIGATEYCDQNGANCTLASDLGAGKWEDGATAGEIYYNDGFVGIGTTNPEALLHIDSNTAGRLYVDAGPSGGTADPSSRIVIEDNTSNSLQFLTPAGSFSSSILFGDSDDADRARIAYAHGTDQLLLEGNSSFLIRSGGQNRLLVDSSGNVGIGTTGPAQQLHATGVGRFDGGVQVDGLNVVGPSGVVHTAFSNTTNYGYFQARNSAGQRGFYLGFGGGDRVDLALDAASDLYIAGGDVGIGEATPDARLEVASARNINYANAGVNSYTENPTLLVTDTSNISTYPSAASVISFRAGNTGVAEGAIGLVRTASNRGDIFFGVAAGAARSEVMRITSFGDVGIGDITPDATLKLDVEGQVGATEYCDQNGANCTAAADIGGLWNENGSEIYYDAGNVGIGGVNGTAFNLRLRDTSVSGDGIRVDLTASNNVFLAYSDSNISHNMFTAGDTGNFFLYSGGTSNTKLYGSGIGLFESYIEANGGFRIDGRAITDANGSVFTARNVTDNNYGYYEVLNDSGSRGAYLGWGNGGTRVDLNLDAAEDLYISGGNVGIGVADATSRLHVGGGDLRVDGLNNANIILNNTGPFTSAMSFRAGDTEYARMRLNGDNSFTFSGTTGADLTFQGGNSANVNFFAGGSGTIKIGGSNSTIDFAPANTANTLLRINTAGDLGIGDLTPDASLKLDVEGQIGATEYCDENGANCTLAADLSGDNLGDHTATQNIDIGGFGLTNADFVSFEDGSGHSISSNPSGLLFNGGEGSPDFLVYDGFAYAPYMLLGYNGSAVLTTYDAGEDLQIQSNGADVWINDNLGIGTANPTQQLHTTGIARFDGGVQVDGRTMISADGYTHNIQSTTESRYGYLDLRDDSGSRGAYFGFGNGASRVDLTLDDANDLYISGGNVGIGVADAQTTLDIASAGANQLRLRNTNATVNSNGYNIYQGQPGNYDGDLVFAPVGGSAAGYMRLGPNGAAFGEGVLVDDGEVFGSGSSVALAFYKPFDGTKGALSFRGATNAEAGFNVEAYYHNGTFNYTGSVARFEADASGNRVGINTLDPTAGLTLDVEGRVGATEYCDQNGANCTAAGSLGAGKWLDGVDAGEIYYSGGNVGVGIDNPEYQIQATNKFGVRNDGVVYWGQDVRSASPILRGQLTWGSGRVLIGANSSGTDTAFSSDFGVERMRITSAGNVGIGSTVPATKLEVVGTLNLTTAEGVHRSSIDWGYTQSGLSVYNRDNSPLTLGTSNTARLAISATGDVSIGSTGYAAKLYIEQNANDEGIYVVNTGTSYGIRSYSPDGIAGYMQSVDNYGTYSRSTNSIGVYGRSDGNSYGVYGYSTGNYGVYGRTTEAGNGGVLGYNHDVTTYGILGYDAWGVYGIGKTYSSGGYVSGRFGLSGTYNSTQTQGIWTVGDGYNIDTVSNDFGNQYGMGYSYDTVGGGISGWGHQIHYLNNGVRNATISIQNGYANFQRIGIGDTTPDVALSVTGEIAATGWVGAGCETSCDTDGSYSLMFPNGTGVFTSSVTASSFVYSSDRRLKENIESLSIGANGILNLGTYRFDWNSGVREGVADFGFIAQEVEQYFPEAVITNEDGYKAVDYAKLVAPLLEVTKQQEERINNLEARLEALENK